jgi:hypothetical protein
MTMTGDTVCGYYEDPFRGLVATVCFDRDSPEAREQIHKDLDARFPGKPHRLVLHRADGTRVALRGDCRNGCCCGCATCKGRPRNRPPQAGAGSRSGKRPPRVGEPVHAEGVDEDGDMDFQQEEAFPEPQWSGKRKPRRDEPERPAEDEQSLHSHVVNLIQALLGHISRTTRRGSKEVEALRGELASAAALLPRSLIGESLRSDANRVLAVSAPPRSSPARRKFFLAMHGIH